MALLELREKLHQLCTAFRTMRPYTQKNLHDRGIGLKWTWDTRDMFLYRDYMGWHNLSEMHRRDQCDDPAYCPWHGNL